MCQVTPKRRFGVKKYDTTYRPILRSLKPTTNAFTTWDNNFHILKTTRNIKNHRPCTRIILAFARAITNNRMITRHKAPNKKKGCSTWNTPKMKKTSVQKDYNRIPPRRGVALFNFLWRIAVFVKSFFEARREILCRFFAISFTSFKELHNCNNSF